MLQLRNSVTTKTNRDLVIDSESNRDRRRRIYNVKIETGGLNVVEIFMLREAAAEKARFLIFRSITTGYTG